MYERASCRPPIWICSLSLCGWICANNTGRAFAHNSCSGIGPGRANPNTCRRPSGNVTSRHVMSRRAGERTPGLTPPDDPVMRPDGNRSNRRPGDLCTGKCIKDSRV